MYFAIDIIVEAQYLSYLVPVVLGVEIAIYCFYYYLTTKDSLLKLNKILLSFGFFILFMIFGAFFLVIVRILDFSNQIGDLLSSIGFSIVMMGPICYMAFIIREEFSKIINLKVAQVLSILNIIPVITALIFSTNSPLFLFTIGFMIINSLYAVYVQIRLIQISLGNIKKRLLEFFAGEVLALISLLFAAQTTLSILPLPTLMTFYIAVFLLTTGFIIIFFAVYNFPPFYEFEWKENIFQYFVMNPERGVLLYFYDFIDPKREGFQKSDKKYILGDIQGVDSMISAITNSKSQLNSITHKDKIVFLEYSSSAQLPLIYGLIVGKNLNSYQYIIKELKVQFESFYKEILQNPAILDAQFEQEQLFSTFDVFMYSFINS